jgi:hypothetical protein
VQKKIEKFFIFSQKQGALCKKDKHYYFSLIAWEGPFPSHKFLGE